MKTESLFHIFSLKGIKSRKDQSFQNSKLKLIASRLLRLSDYERLLNLDSTETFLKDLQNRIHYEFNTQLSMKENCQMLYHTRIMDSIRSFDDYSSYSSDFGCLTEYFFIPWDLSNFKLIAKAQKEALPFDKLEFAFYGFCSHEKLSSVFHHKALGFLHPYLKDSLKMFENVYNTSFTPYDIDLFWDKVLHDFYKNILTRMNSEVLTTLYKTQIDIKNILTVLRMKISEKDISQAKSAIIAHGNLSIVDCVNIFNQDIEALDNTLEYLLYSKEIQLGLEGYKESKNFSLLEKALTSFLLKKYAHFISLVENEDLAIILSWLQENELSNIQLIFAGIENGIDKHWILSQLRGTI